MALQFLVVNIWPCLDISRLGPEFSEIYSLQTTSLTISKDESSKAPALEPGRFWISFLELLSYKLWLGPARRQGF
jgi:hypothetical protein